MIMVQLLDIKYNHLWPYVGTIHFWCGNVWGIYMGGYYTDKYRQPKYLLSGHSLTKILPGKEYTRFIITRIPRDMV